MTSCKDFLYPESYNNLTSDYYYQTDDQITAALTSVYTVLRTSIVTSTYITNFHGYSDEDFHYNYSTDRPNNYSATSSNSNVASLWTGYYGALKDISFLLWGLEENQGSLSEDVYKNAKGEALFFRAFFHFKLAQWWAHPSTGGIPMYIDRVTSYEDTSMPISPIYVIYDQCIQDLAEAEALLTETGQTWASLGYSERVTVDAILGMTARVALTAAGYPNNGKLADGTDGGTYYYELARDKAKDLVDNYGHTLEENYEDVWIAATQDAYVNETIFEVGYTFYGNESGNDDYNCSGGVGTTGTFGMERRFNDATGSDIYDSLPCTGYRNHHPRLLMSYGIAGDDRKNWNCPNFGYEYNHGTKQYKTIYAGDMATDVENGADTTLESYYPSVYQWTPTVGKWRREYEDRSLYRTGENANGTNYPLIRYADVLLMLAEAYIELGSPASAVPYIETVRKRSIKNDSYLTVTSVVIDNVTNSSDRGYTNIPDYTITDYGGGSGLSLNLCYDGANYARLKIGILDGGSGYTSAPTIELGGKVQTWEPYTAYNFYDHVSVEFATADTATDEVTGEEYYTGDTTRIYRIYRCTDQSGTSTDTPPTHYSTEGETGDVDAEGLTWALEGPANSTAEDYMSASGYTQAGPSVHTRLGMTVSPYVSDHVSSTGSQDEMREFLRDERRRELCSEALRRHDLKRWGILSETMKALADDNTANNDEEGTLGNWSNSSSYTNIQDMSASYSSIQEYLPIPLAQISLNRNLVQNPGY